MSHTRRAKSYSSNWCHQQVSTVYIRSRKYHTLHASSDKSQITMMHKTAMMKVDINLPNSYKQMSTLKFAVFMLLFFSNYNFSY